MNGQELRARRKGLKLSQSELGQRLGVTDRAVRLWEKGEAPISPAIDFATRYLVEHPAVTPDEA